MTSQSIILGTINGISKRDFDILKKDLEKCFDKVGWKDNAIFIKSEKNHPRMKSIFTRIADYISKNNFGSLLYIGNEKVVCVYFGHKKFEGKTFRQPKTPDWWESDQETQK